jgi:hypothetical protein
MLDDVENSVRSAHVNYRAQSAEGQTENGHRFSHSGERSSPLNIGNPQDGTYESSRMAYADEKNEVDDVDTPENGSV